MASNAGGYDFELVDSSMKIYECPICLMLIQETVELPCTHVLCKQCLKKWEQKECLKICPTCQKAYQSEKTKPSKITDRVISTSLKVKCKNEHCNWTGVIVDYGNHENVCPMKEIQCPHEGCDTKLASFFMDEHTKECPFHLVKCEMCGEAGLYSNLPTHYASCEFYPINCPNEGCDFKIERCKMPEHRSLCLYEIVKCCYDMVGCIHTLPRKEMEIHEEKETGHHMKLLLRDRITLIQKVEDLEGKYKCSLKQYKEIKKELEVTKTEICEIKTSNELILEFEQLRHTKIEENKQKKAGETKHKTIEIQNSLDNLEKKVSELDDFVLKTIVNIVIKMEEKFAGTKFALRNINRPRAEIMSLSKVEDIRNNVEDGAGGFEIYSSVTENLKNILSLPFDYSKRLKSIQNSMDTWKLYQTEDTELFMNIYLGLFPAKKFKIYFTIAPDARVLGIENTFKILYTNDNVVICNSNFSCHIFFSETWDLKNTSLCLKTPKGPSFEKGNIESWIEPKKILKSDNEYFLLRLQKDSQ